MAIKWIKKLEVSTKSSLKGETESPRFVKFTDHTIRLSKSLVSELKDNLDVLVGLDEESKRLVITTNVAPEMTDEKLRINKSDKPNSLSKIKARNIVKVIQDNLGVQVDTKGQRYVAMLSEDKTQIDIALILGEKPEEKAPETEQTA